jgi:hypothetical protein
VIEARARPLGKARVDFTLTPVHDGTRVTIDETFVSPLIMRMLNPLFARLIRSRNDETLRRLARVVSVSALK